MSTTNQEDVKLQIRDDLAEQYSAIYTPEALAALTFMAQLNTEQKRLMNERTRRRATRIKEQKPITFLDPNDEIKGTGIAAFVTVKSGIKPTDELKKELLAHVVKEIGAIARPDMLRFTDALPKTRSGKIMRRLLREIAAGKVPTGDTTTLEDFNVLAKLRESEES